MKLHQHLQKLNKITRKALHPLVHIIHKQHKISRRTLFYIKEYGPHTNVPKTIIKESIKILLLASIISSIGGLALEHIKNIFITLIPLVILLPVLNDMIGDYGTIISSRFSTMLYEGKIEKKWWKNSELKELFSHLIIISVITAVLSSLVALVISSFSNYHLNLDIAAKVLLIVVIDVILLVSILMVISVVAGIYFFSKKEDPNNFLIPLTTSFADLANMVILTALILLFF